MDEMDETDETDEIYERDESDTCSESYMRVYNYPNWIAFRAISVLILGSLFWGMILKNRTCILRNPIIDNYPFLQSSIEPSKFVFVTSYYDIGNKSKASSQQYYIWVTKLLDIFVGTLYFYTSDTFALNITTKIRGNVQFVTKYRTVWDIPCVSGFTDIYAKQYEIDPEKYHSPDLYAIWNSKVCLMKEISNLYPQSIVFWIDSGSVREPIYNNITFPNRTRMNEVFPNRTTDGQMIFAMRKKLLMERYSPRRLLSYAWAIGGFFGGDHAAILSLHDEFWEMHSMYLQKGHFVGCDQFLFSTYMLYHDNVLIQPNYQAMNRCDPWFSTYSFYGNTKTCFHLEPKLIPVRYFVK